MIEPEEYSINISQLLAFSKGLMSREETIGFIKGTIIKYVVRCERKDNKLEDIEKAMDYLKVLYTLFEEEEKK